jgi:hypothetical protein
MGRRISVGTLLIAGDRGKADIPPQGRDFRFGPHRTSTTKVGNRHTCRSPEPWGGEL